MSALGFVKNIFGDKSDVIDDIIDKAADEAKDKAEEFLGGGSKGQSQQKEDGKAQAEKKSGGNDDQGEMSKANNSAADQLANMF